MAPTTVASARHPRLNSQRPVALTVAALLLSISGCQDPAPVPVNRSDSLALGAFSLKVSRVQMMSGDYLAQLSQVLRAPPSSSFLSVVLRVEEDSQETGASPQRRAEVLVDELMAGLKLEDGQGNQYDRPLAIPSSAFQMMTSYRPASGATPQNLDIMARAQTGANIPGDWTAVFSVPGDARDFQLLIRNRDRRAEQPRIVAVDLGR